MDLLWSRYKSLTQFQLDNVKHVAILSGMVIAAGYIVSLMGVVPGQYRLETERCMQELGCFSIYGEYTLRPFNLLPQHRSVVGTKFILHNANKTKTEFSYTATNSLVEELDPAKGIIMVIHGWISSRHDPAIKVWCFDTDRTAAGVRMAYSRELFQCSLYSLPGWCGCISHPYSKVLLWKYLMEELNTCKAEFLNIVFVEWKRGSTQTYPQAVANTRIVGAEIAHLLQLAQPKIQLQKVHIVGISLGAHIAGSCGSLIPGIGRITALDAAGPLFEHYPTSIRLDPSDALFVDAIHTDGDDFYKVVMAEGGLGIHHSIGHADFYPNGGHTQPHCTGVMSKTITDLTSGEFQNVQLKKLVACDHELSLDYFTQSILTSDSYPAYACDGDIQGFIDGRCNSTNYMGYGAHKPSIQTNYYLQMSHSHPYQGSHYMVTVSLKVKDLVCLSMSLNGASGLAEQVEEPGFKRSCSASSTQTAMLFSDQPIHAIKELIIVWEDNAASHSQVLVHGLTQLTVINATVKHGNQRYYSCSGTQLGFTHSATMPLSADSCDIQ